MFVDLNWILDLNFFPVTLFMYLRFNYYDFKKIEALFKKMVKSIFTHILSHFSNKFIDIENYFYKKSIYRLI